MSRRNLVIIVISVTIVGVASLLLHEYLRPREPEREIEYVEDVGGAYNATITVFKGTFELGGKEYQYGEIRYVRDGKNYTECSYDVQSRDALDWVKENTPENATFLNWWDYGHMIVAVAEREAIVTGPSPETLYVIANPDFEPPEYSDHQAVVDVAEAFATSNETETVKIMEKYDADYAYLSYADEMKCWWFFNVSGRDPSQYISHRTIEEVTFTAEGENTMFYKLLFDKDPSPDSHLPMKTTTS
jgi:hypothetical protein